MELAIDKFHPERLGCITGSKAHILMPESGKVVQGMQTYAKQLAKERYFQHYDEVSSWQMEHGNQSEPYALAHWRKYVNPDLQDGYFKRIGELAGTCDHICDDYIVDSKCPVTMEKWLDYLYDGINKQQYHQGQMYCFLFNRPRIIFGAYLCETNRMSDYGLVYPVPESQRLIQIEVVSDPNWIDKFMPMAEKVIAMRDEYIELLSERFPIDTSKVI